MLFWGAGPTCRSVQKPSRGEAVDCLCKASDDGGMLSLTARTVDTNGLSVSSLSPASAMRSSPIEFVMLIASCVPLCSGRFRQLLSCQWTGPRGILSYPNQHGPSVH